MVLGLHLGCNNCSLDKYAKFFVLYQLSIHNYTNSQVKVLALDIPHLDASLHVSRGCTLTFQPGTLLRTHPTLVWVSSQVSHHLMVMRSGVTLHPMQGQCPSPVLPHRAGTNFTPWYGEAVAYRNTAQWFHPSPTFARTGVTCALAPHVH